MARIQSEHHVPNLEKLVSALESERDNFMKIFWGVEKAVGVYTSVQDPNEVAVKLCQAIENAKISSAEPTEQNEEEEEDEEGIPKTHQEALGIVAEKAFNLQTYLLELNLSLRNVEASIYEQKPLPTYVVVNFHEDQPGLEHTFACDWNVPNQPPSCKTCRDELTVWLYKESYPKPVSDT